MNSLNNLHCKTAIEIATLVKSKQISALEVINYYIQRAEELNPKLNALNTITKDIAIQQAKIVDQRILEGDTDMPLAGVPIIIKDNICVRNTKTTCSSKILENFTANYEATVTKKLWKAGAICLGKANLDEFAMGSSNEYSAFGAVLNPYNLDYVPGGSSGGSACSVSARLAPISLGSDTGGSIRQPASFCGVTGYKPSYGRVSRYGLMAFGSSLDQIGPFANTMEDIQLVMSVIEGHDPKDSTSIDCKPVDSQDKVLNLKGLRIGILKEVSNMDSSILNVEVKESIQATCDSLQEQGAEIKEISMPLSIEHALDCYYIIAPAEASSNLSRYDGVRYGYRDQSSDNLLDLYLNSRSKGFGTEVKRRIMIGAYVLSAGYYDAYYKKAMQVRNLIKQEYEQIFNEVDVILSPTSPFTAFKLNSKTDDLLSMYSCDLLTIPANLAGLPAISINNGFDSNNLPIGLQLVAPFMHDNQLLNISQQIENIIISQDTKDKLPAIAIS